MQRSRVSLGQAAALVEQRDLDVFDDRVLRQQVVGLEDEADVAAADLGELVVVHVGDVFVAEEIMAAGAAVEAAEQVQQRGFARAGRAHQGDEVAFLEVERHAGEGGHDDLFHLVVLDEVDDSSDGGHGGGDS